MSIPRIFLVFCLALPVLVLNACSGLTKSDKPAISKWWLEPYTINAQAGYSGPVLPVAVSISSVPGLDTDRILTLSADAELGQYAATRWVDHAPDLFASLLERSMRSTGRFVMVSEGAATRPGNCHLDLELQEFFAGLDAAGNTSDVRVAVYGRFQCDNDEPVLVRSASSVAVTEERMKTIVAAFQKSVDHVVQDIIDKI